MTNTLALSLLLVSSALDDGGETDAGAPSPSVEHAPDAGALDADGGLERDAGTSGSQEPGGESPLAASPLHAAIRADDRAEVQRLLKAGTSPEAFQQHEDSPIELAVMLGKLDIARALHAAGARLTAETERLSLVYLAVAGGFTDLALWLIDAGASLATPKDSERLTPTSAALSAGNLKVLQALLDKKVAPSAEELRAVAYDAQPGLIPWLLARVKDRALFGPLLAELVKAERLDDVRLLLKAGVPPEATSEGLVGLALEHKQPELAKLLLQYGADPNRPRASYTEPPLREAVGARDPAMVKLLLGKGASPNVWHPQLGSPVRTLFRLERPNDPTDLEIFELLLKAGLDVNLAGYKQSTALVSALLWKDERLVERFLKKGANPNGAKNSVTPLQLAVDGHVTGAVSALLAAGADPNLVYQLSSPLVLATLGNRFDLVNLLLKAGARVDQSGPKGRTALDFAIGRNLREMAELLTRAEREQAATKPPLRVPGLDLDWRVSPELADKWDIFEDSRQGTQFSLKADPERRFDVRAWPTGASCVALAEAVVRAFPACTLTRSAAWPGLDPVELSCREGVASWRGCLAAGGTAFLFEVGARRAEPKAGEQAMSAMVRSLASALKARPPPIPGAAPRLPLTRWVAAVPRGAEEWTHVETHDAMRGLQADVLVRAVPAKNPVVLELGQHSYSDCKPGERTRPRWLESPWVERHAETSKGWSRLDLCAPSPNKGMVRATVRSMAPLTRSDEQSIARLLDSVSDAAGLERSPVAADAQGLVALGSTGLLFTPNAKTQRELFVSVGSAPQFANIVERHLRFVVVSPGQLSNTELAFVRFDGKPGKGAKATCATAMSGYHVLDSPIETYLGVSGWREKAWEGTNKDGHLMQVACRETRKGPVLAIARLARAEDQTLCAVLLGQVSEAPAPPAPPEPPKPVTPKPAAPPKAKAPVTLKRVTEKPATKFATKPSPKRTRRSSEPADTPTVAPRARPPSRRALLGLKYLAGISMSGGGGSGAPAFLPPTFAHGGGLELRLGRFFSLRTDLEFRQQTRNWDIIGAKFAFISGSPVRPYLSASVGGLQAQAIPGKILLTLVGAGGIDVHLGRHFFFELEVRFRGNPELTGVDATSLTAVGGVGVAFF